MQSAATTSAIDLEPVKDNIDNRSVCSSVCSSMKNAELIMAAFSSNQLSLTIEEENGESEKTSKSSEVSPSQASTGIAEIIEKESNAIPSGECSNNNANELANNDEDDEMTPNNLMIANENQQQDLDEIMNTSEIQQSGDLNISDLLDETIANVASGSISKSTTKAIANKQKLMLKNSKKQEKNYYKLKKLREKENKKKTLARLEKLRKVERERIKEEKKAAKKNNIESKEKDSVENPIEGKKKRYRRTKLELLKFRENQLALKNEKLEKKTTKLKSNDQQAKLTKLIDIVDEHLLPQKRKYKKKFSTINTFDETFKKRKGKLTAQPPQIEERILKKRGPKPKIKPQEIIKPEPEDLVDSELIFEPTTDTYPNGLDNEETDGELDMSVNIMKRTCLVCNFRMHQDELADHLTSHYKETSKCPECDKNSTNHSNYVTHLLSHLPSQFYCSTCDKWFRQPIVYKRHQKDCIDHSITKTNDTNRRASIKQEKSLKRKATHEALIAEMSTVDEQTNKRTRRVRKISVTSSTASSTSRTQQIEIKQEPVVVQQEPVVVVKRRQGRPPKNKDTITVKKEPEEKKVTEKKKSKLDLQSVEPILDENQSKKSLRPRDKLNKSNKKKSTELKTSIKAEKIVRRKSDRLLSTSSAISSSSSSNGQKIKKPSNEQLKYESDNSPLNSNEYGDNISDQMDGIDDIVVSEFEMDQEQIDNLDSNNSSSLPEESKTKPDHKTLTALNTNLNITGTYKVKIQLRRPSNNYNNSSQIKQKENNDTSTNINSLKEFQNPQTPSKIINNVFILNEQPSSVIKLQATPSKQDTNNPLNNQNITNSTSNSHTFECPECDKKFVSYYGLFQHYDQHPNLAVSCSTCQITFENHQALCVHNTKLHPEFLSEFNEFKSNRLQAELSKSNQQAAKKVDTTKSGNNNRSNSVKQSLNFSGKSKSQTNDLTTGDMIIPGVINPNINDLSALPSIMTRTSRLTNGNSNNEKNGLNTISNASLVKTAAAISNHNLVFKTTGFADLSFIDFSCSNFPRIAQNYCELLPRKLPTNSETFQQQIQPLHNYSCKECGFFFPCKASLKLHKMKKQLASSKLEKEKDEISLAIVKRNEPKSRCPLFMTNSKTMCYEKCLDEIIGRIEEKIERQKPDKSLSEFLNIFGLIEVDSLPNFKTEFFNSTAFLSNSKGKAKDLNNSLVNYISPSHISTNLSEDLSKNLRKQLLEINHQFIIDLDRWKLIHSSDSSFLVESSKEYDMAKYSNKIHLKPHVNLNRPILIRSKKLKRNATMKQNSNKNLNAASPRHQPFRSAQMATAINKIVNKMPSLITAAPVKKTPQITQVTSKPAVKVNLNGPKFSKPFFTATSGNFSASNYSPTNKPNLVSKNNANGTTSQMNKKRKLEQQKELLEMQKQQKIQEERLNKKRKQQQPKKEEEEESMMLESFDSDQFEENEIMILPENIESQTEDDEEYSYYDEDEKEPKFTTLKFSKPVDPKLTNGTAKNQSFTSGMNTNQKSDLKNLIIPPPLYKVPVKNFSTAIFTSAANSSILANASGMNNNLIKKNMPKLLPAPSKPANNPSNLTDNPNNSTSNVALMPKLIPTTPQPHRNINRSLPLKPPQLIKSGSATSKSAAQTRQNIPTRPVGRPPNTQTKQQSTNQSLINQSTSSTKSPPKNGKNSNKNPESHSLKCKFCFQIFEGQPEFFQHVIKSHPKMLEQRLNRSNSVPNQGPKSPGTTTTKRLGRPPITASNGSSNHSTSSASSSSNASKRDSKS